jgi:hypothetical protein
MTKSILLAVVIVSLGMQACVAAVTGDPSRSKREQIEQADRADAELSRKAK